MVATKQIARCATAGDRIFDLVVGTLLTLSLVIVIYPLVFVVSASISDPEIVVRGGMYLLPRGITFESYKHIFRNENILIGYRNTLAYTFVGTIVNLAMTIAGAYPLSRRDFYGRNALTLMFTFTMFFSGGLIPTYLVVKSLGLVNKFWVMVLPGAVWVYNLIIMRTFFSRSIPEELTEAAYIDGSSNFGTLIRIVLPLSTPIIAVMVIYYGVGHWNAFFNALIYISDRSRYPLQLVLREILIMGSMQEMLQQDAETFLEQQLMSEALKYSAVIVSSIPVLVLYPFLQRYFAKGIMIGALKG